MQKFCWAKFIGVLVTAVVLTACSSTKNKGAAAANQSDTGEGAYATGAAGDGFTDGDAANNKVCAPCEQTYHFDFDEDVVHQDDIASIEAQANYLVAHHTAKVRLEGYTDERGSKEYNVALGWRRAKAVARILQQDGVAPAQIVVISYGEEKPIAAGHDEDSWQQNRRVELVYEAK